MLSSEELQKLDQVACAILKVQAKTRDLSILELTARVDEGIYTVKNALAYYDAVVKQAKFRDEDKDYIQKLCIKALKHSFETSKPLNIQELVTQLDFSLLDSKKVLDYFQKEFRLTWPLPKSELDQLNTTSKIVVKYLAEVSRTKKGYKPSVAELVGRLGITLRQAKLIIPFINKVSTENIAFKFDEFEESEFSKLDSLAKEMIKTQETHLNLSLTELASDLGVGIYTARQVISYFSWISNEYIFKPISDISSSKLKELDKKATRALQNSIKNSQELTIINLIKNLDFGVREAKEVLLYYQQALSLDLDLVNLTDSELALIEDNARKIYELVDKKVAKGYDFDDLIPHVDLGIVDTMKAILYLKQKIMPNLQVTARSIFSSGGKISLAKGKIEIAESLSVEDQALDVRNETVKIKDHSIDLKKMIKRVEVGREYDYVGGRIRFKVAIRNNSGTMINDVEVSLGMPDHVRIMNIAPKIYSRKTHAKVNSIKHGESQSIDFYLEPLICGTAPIEVRLFYHDAFGEQHSIMREPKHVVTKCPPIINLGEENFARVKHLFESELQAKQLKSFRIENDPKRTFEILNEGVNSWAQKSVTKPIIRTTPAFRGENYYFVKSKVADMDLKGRQEQIVVRIETDADLGLSFLQVACEKGATASGVLTHVWEIVQRRMAEAFGIKLCAMYCPECGAPLKHCPEIGESITCKACGERFKAEALTG